MRVEIYYLSGNYGSIDTTIQSIQDGILLDDGYLDAENLETEGLVLTRASYITSAEGRQSMQHGSATIVTPEELANIGLVTVDGRPFLKRLSEDGGFEKCLIGLLQDMGVCAEDVPIEVIEDEGPDVEYAEEEALEDDVDV